MLHRIRLRDAKIKKNGRQESRKPASFYNDLMQGLIPVSFDLYHENTLGESVTPAVDPDDLITADFLRKPANIPAPNVVHIKINLSLFLESEVNGCIYLAC